MLFFAERQRYETQTEYAHSGSIPIYKYGNILQKRQ